MPIRSPLAYALAATILTAIPALAQDAAFDSAVPQTKPSGEIVYNALNEAIQMGTAWGDRATGAHGTFGKFIGNFATPFHKHSEAYHGVVLSGTMTNPFKGIDEDNPARMQVGSYWYVPANAVHATTCVSAEPCSFFFTADGSFDFIVAE